MCLFAYPSTLLTAASPLLATPKLTVWNSSIALDEGPAKFVDQTTPCFDNDACTGGAICFFGSCICPFGTYPYMHECRVEGTVPALSDKNTVISLELVD